MVEETLVQSITGYGFIGVALVAVGLFLKSYINKHDVYVERQDAEQHALITSLMEQLAKHSEIMSELKNSITELSTIIKRKEEHDDLR